jgi:hypothetical protein
MEKQTTDMCLEFGLVHCTVQTICNRKTKTVSAFEAWMQCTSAVSNGEVRRPCLCIICVLSKF